MKFLISLGVNLVGWIIAAIITHLAGWEWNLFQVFTYLVIGMFIQGFIDIGVEVYKENQ